MAVSARFRVSRVTPMAWASKDEPTVEVEMTPDYADGRNKDWAKYTPCGVFRMTVNNPDVIAVLVQNRAVEIMITPVDGD